MRGTKAILGQIEEDALNGGAGVADALRKCMVLGGRAGSAELRDWASRELDGYFGVPEDEIPAYREISAPLLIDGISGNYQVKGEPISPASLPDVAQQAGLGDNLILRHGIGELEELARSAKDKGFVHLAVPGYATLATLMSAELDDFRVVNSIYWSVFPVALFGVLDQVRNRLVRFVSELRAVGADENAPTSHEVANAVHVAVQGKRSRVTVITTQASGGGNAVSKSGPPAQTSKPWWRTTKAMWGFLAGAASIGGLILAWLQLK